MTGSEMRLWWQERSEREQQLIGVMFALLLFVLTWLLIARPLVGALESSRLRHGQAVVALADAKARSSRGSRFPASTAALPSLPVGALITRTATEAGFTGARIAAQGPASAQVTIASARAPAYFAWIAALEDQGVRVESLRVTANPDRTISAVALFSGRRR